MLLPIYTFLPVWAQNGGTAKMLSNVRDPWLAKRILKEMDADQRERRNRSPRRRAMISLSEDRFGKWGDTMVSADEREVMLRLMSETRLRGIVLAKVIDQDIAATRARGPAQFHCLKRAELRRNERDGSN